MAQNQNDLLGWKMLCTPNVRSVSAELCQPHSPALRSALMRGREHFKKLVHPAVLVYFSKVDMCKAKDPSQTVY